MALPEKYQKYIAIFWRYFSNTSYVYILLDIPDKVLKICGEKVMLTVKSEVRVTPSYILTLMFGRPKNFSCNFPLLVNLREIRSQKRQRGLRRYLNN